MPCPMHLLRTRGRPLVWLASLALLVLALAPALSQSLGGASRTAWIEVCSAAGMRLVASGAPSAPGDDDTAWLNPLAHCPGCGNHLPAWAPPPALARVAVEPAAGDALPRAFLAAPHTLPVWRSAQPRGPPQA